MRQNLVLFPRRELYVILGSYLYLFFWHFFLIILGCAPIHPIQWHNVGVDVDDAIQLLKKVENEEDFKRAISVLEENRRPDFQWPEFWGHSELVQVTSEWSLDYLITLIQLLRKDCSVVNYRLFHEFSLNNGSFLDEAVTLDFCSSPIGHDQFVKYSNYFLLEENWLSIANLYVFEYLKKTVKPDGSGEFFWRLNQKEWQSVLKALVATERFQDAVYLAREYRIITHADKAAQRFFGIFWFEDKSFEKLSFQLSPLDLLRFVEEHLVLDKNARTNLDVKTRIERLHLMAKLLSQYYKVLLDDFQKRDVRGDLRSAVFSQISESLHQIERIGHHLVSDQRSPWDWFVPWHDEWILKIEALLLDFLNESPRGDRFQIVHQLINSFSEFYSTQFILWRLSQKISLKADFKGLRERSGRVQGLSIKYVMDEIMKNRMDLRTTIDPHLRRGLWIEHCQRLKEDGYPPRFVRAFPEAYDFLENKGCYFLIPETKGLDSRQDPEGLQHVLDYGFFEDYQETAIMFNPRFEAEKPWIMDFDSVLVANGKTVRVDERAIALTLIDLSFVEKIEDLPLEPPPIEDSAVSVPFLFYLEVPSQNDQPNYHIFPFHHIVREAAMGRLAESVPLDGQKGGHLHYHCRYKKCRLPVLTSIGQKGQKASPSRRGGWGSSILFDEKKIRKKIDQKNLFNTEHLTFHSYPGIDLLVRLFELVGAQKIEGPIRLYFDERIPLLDGSTPFQERLVKECPEGLDLCMENFAKESSVAFGKLIGSYRDLRELDPQSYYKMAENSLPQVSSGRFFLEEGGRGPQNRDGRRGPSGKLYIHLE